jgi:hypothetical protein
MSAFNCVSALSTSIGRPLTLPPKSSAAHFTVWNKPSPTVSEEALVMSLRMPILTVSPEKESAANAEPAGDAKAASALQTASAAQVCMTNPPSRSVARLGDPPLPRLRPIGIPALMRAAKRVSLIFYL